MYVLNSILRNSNTKRPMPKFCIDSYLFWVNSVKTYHSYYARKDYITAPINIHSFVLMIMYTYVCFMKRLACFSNIASVESRLYPNTTYSSQQSQGAFHFADE